MPEAAIPPALLPPPRAPRLCPGQQSRAGAGAGCSWEVTGGGGGGGSTDGAGAGGGCAHQLLLNCTPVFEGLTAASGVWDMFPSVPRGRGFAGSRGFSFGSLWIWQWDVRRAPWSVAMAVLASSSSSHVAPWIQAP